MPTVVRSNRKIGFELEMYSPVDISYRSFYWGDTVDDGSINPRGTQFPVEFRSNPITGTNLFETIDEIHKNIIRKYKCGTNRTCGFHVHIDMSNSTEKQRKNIQGWWAFYEPAFYLLIPLWRRESDWCNPTRHRYGLYREFPYHRDTALNITAYEKHGTFEIRLHQGTTKKSNIKYWTHLWLLFFDKYQDIPPPDELPPSSEAHNLLKGLLKEIEAPQSMITFFKNKVEEYA